MRISRTNTLSINKIKKNAQLQSIAFSLRTNGKKIVFTNGCFDILHYGHVEYLEKAKQTGDILIVGLNSDASVKRIKGKNRPIVNEKDRAAILAALESVNYVVLFDESTPLKVIQTIKPDILIKGADWNENKIVGADFVKSYGGCVKRINLAKGRSTTNLIKKIAKTFGKIYC